MRGLPAQLGARAEASGAPMASPGAGGTDVRLDLAAFDEASGGRQTLSSSRSGKYNTRTGVDLLPGWGSCHTMSVSEDYQ